MNRYLVALPNGTDVTAIMQDTTITGVRAYMFEPDAFNLPFGYKGTLHILADSESILHLKLKYDFIIQYVFNNVNREVY